MGTFITGAIVVLCVFFAIRSMVNDKRNGKTHCGGDCSRCKGHCH
ncbi:MAG: FeoB-associated Cys-rich membrane protein [Lachnospiraceae bacterium]